MSQIDLLINRKEETVHICEMKYAKEPFEITKEYEEKLSNKINAFSEETGRKKSLLLTMITTYGVKQNLS